jgi:hypothetical protein
MYLIIPDIRHHVYGLSLISPFTTSVSKKKNMKATQAWYNTCNIRHGIVILSAAKNRARWTVRFFAALRMTISKNRVDIWKSAYKLKQEREPGTFCEVFRKVTHSGRMIARHSK